MLSYFFDILRVSELIIAYRTCNRAQMRLLPQCVENYVGLGDPVRTFNAFVEALDINKFDIVIDPRKFWNSG